MKKNILPVISCILCIILLISVFSLKSQIKTMENRFNDQLNRINSSVADIPSSIRSGIEAANSIISESGWERGEYDTESGKIGVSFYVLPKEYSDKTEAEICIDGQWHKMSMENGRFIFDTQLSVFGSNEVSAIKLTDGETIKTESSFWGIDLRNEFVPYVYASMSTNIRTDTPELSGTINVDISYNSSERIPDFDEAYLVTTENGDVIEKEKINLEYEQNDHNYRYAHYDFEKFPELKDGSIYRMYLAMVDQNDFVYVVFLDRYQLDTDGRLREDMSGTSGEADIYNKNGELLYRA